MSDFQNKKMFKKFFVSKPVIIILFVLLVFFAYSVSGLIKKYKQTAQNKNNVQNEKEELLKRQIELQNELDSLNTVRGQEESIRERFSVVKDGEGLINIVDAPDSQSTSVITKPKGIWGWIVGIFKK